jgi:hypothetical protein
MTGPGRMVYLTNPKEISADEILQELELELQLPVAKN